MGQPEKIDPGANMEADFSSKGINKCLPEAARLLWVSSLPPDKTKECAL